MIAKTRADISVNPRGKPMTHKPDSKWPTQVWISQNKRTEKWRSMDCRKGNFSHKGFHCARWRRSCDTEKETDELTSLMATSSFVWMFVPEEGRTPQKSAEADENSELIGLLNHEKKTWKKRSELKWKETNLCKSLQMIRCRSCGRAGTCSPRKDPSALWRELGDRFLGPRRPIPTTAEEPIASDGTSPFPNLLQDSLPSQQPLLAGNLPNASTRRREFRSAGNASWRRVFLENSPENGPGDQMSEFCRLPGPVSPSAISTTNTVRKKRANPTPPRLPPSFIPPSHPHPIQLNQSTITAA